MQRYILDTQDRIHKFEAISVLTEQDVQRRLQEARDAIAAMDAAIYRLSAELRRPV